MSTMEVLLTIGVGVIVPMLGVLFYEVRRVHDDLTEFRKENAAEHSEAFQRIASLEATVVSMKESQK